MAAMLELGYAWGTGMLAVMKRRYRSGMALLLLAFVVTVRNSFAASCVQGKPVKVQKLCGVVVDNDNVPIPNATLELTDLRIDLPDIVQTLRSDQNGQFSFVDVPSGEYAIGAKYPGSARAARNVLVGKANQERSARKPSPSSFDLRAIAAPSQSSVRLWR